ncbi:hypothetical protein Metig_0493 [Methanotorris igneus Kol 5]|uniref:Uncharacterized protein n=1 Tax=Methanotorris igneus (strain DSM 5666 / JCM 11834 / Kol 5) TaxID=880724 RepID=F6BBP0_METIK|nr:hypothetical protein Metig_0493 [Methanotorris igneus Kol 5]
MSPKELINNILIHKFKYIYDNFEYKIMKIENNQNNIKINGAGEGI